MTDDATASLPEQRRLLREQLGAQRLRLTHQLADAGEPRTAFPRSITMRWLIREPELVSRIVERVAGRRIAATVPTALLLARFLRIANE